MEDIKIILDMIIIIKKIKDITIKINRLFINYYKKK